MLLLLTALLLPVVAAITVEIFADAACDVSLGNSSVYRGWAGVCNTATAPDSGYSIGLDFCSPGRVAMSVFTDPSAGVNEVWGGSFPCAAPANVTIDLVANACTPVLPCSTCSRQYFKLVDTQCDAPAPVLLLQLDRGEDPAAVLGCAGPLSANAGQRFQTREVVVGACNSRTVTQTPEQVRPNSGNCGTANSACTRLDVNSVSMQVQRNAVAGEYDITTFFADTCSQSALPLVWSHIPEQTANSLFCRLFDSWSTRLIQEYARHGLRVYAPQPYVTLRSSSPSPSLSGTPTVSPSPSSRHWLLLLQRTLSSERHSSASA